jgi:hypothetical protein
MSTARQLVAPRTFFLNEQHELARGEKERGGRLPKLAPIDWQVKGQKLHRSLSKAREVIQRSRDPLRESRYFLATVPAAKIEKLSTNARLAPTGILEEQTDYAGEHSRVFKRLGLDLLAVDETGRALIHAPASRLEQLLTTTRELVSEGLREQARWVSIDSFDPAPTSFRIDEEWLNEIPARSLLDAVVELQPLLSRVEVEQVIQGILALLGSRTDRERFTRTGTDFSGRHWYRGTLSRESLELIAGQFYSVQALHPPLQTEVALANPRRSSGGGHQISQGAQVAANPTLMPVVAVVDVGVPSGHVRLAPYRRGGYTSPEAPLGLVTDHGSLVASRIVFGDPDFASGIHEVTASCAFLDVNVASDAQHIEDKSLLTALQAVVGAYPDVRVFNLSVGEYSPLNSHPPVKRREKLLLLQDLDNFILRSDVVVVVAAGNSLPGIIPTPNYPNHVDNPEWALGSWACGFNTLTCGSYVGRLSPGGLVGNLGWPSPFTRIGPGLCGAAIPEFAANGGNCTDQFQFVPGLGVWACNAAGVWEDHPGTSYAAPLLAREAAFAMRELQLRCEQGARPFAATVKAFLALTAQLQADFPESMLSLVERTLGRGTGSAERLGVPQAESAVMIWQGIINDSDDKVRIQVPIPRAWLQEAAHPSLRIVGAWESPVNEAVEHIWASRKVEVQFRPVAASKALKPRGRSHRSYPILDRSYDLAAETLAKNKVTPADSDFWILEVSYKEIAEYAATVEFSPQQRVGIALEITDRGDLPVSPQPAMQALPQAVTMTRLTIPENRIPNPVLVRPRV